jgi:RecA-family ATPase
MLEPPEHFRDDGESFDFEIPYAIEMGLQSWRRIVHASHAEDMRDHLKRAAVELLRAAKISFDGGVHQYVIDQLQQLADAVGMDADDAQSIFTSAKDAPSDHRVNEDEADAPGRTPPHRLTFLEPAQWAGKPVPQQRWLVRNRIPRPAVTILSGDGAVGKTTIVLQLAVATPRGTDWLGAMVDEPGPAIFYSAEEPQDEIHRHLARIVDHQGISFADLAGLHVLCRPNDDAVFGAPNRAGQVLPTPLFEEFTRAAGELRPALIAIEAAADVFAGNENDRAQARQFIGLLRRLALKADAAVLLLAHPSLSGMATGTGTSGSTAWNNSVRSRLYFKAVKGQGDEPDSDIRELRVMKSNYGPPGETVRLRWQSGLFVPEASQSLHQRSAAERTVDDAFMRCLDTATAQGRSVSANRSNAYAPAVFERMPEAGGAKSSGLAQAMERLFSTGKIKVETSGPQSKRRQRLVRVV